jgi:hypothetical protein
MEASLILLLVLVVGALSLPAAAPPPSPEKELLAWVTAQGCTILPSFPEDRISRKEGYQGRYISAR